MEHGTTNKRARDESGEDCGVKSPASKRIRVDSYHSGPNSIELIQALDESVVNSPELNSLRDDLLYILDDSDAVSVTDRYPEIQDLDSVIRSFEEEIVDRLPVVSEMTSGSGESQPELGFLLEASDDELGLPPTHSSAGDDNNQTVDLARLSSEAVVFGDTMGFDDELPSYHSYEFGIGGEQENGGGEYVALGGLFDYDPADYCENSYTAEWLPAL